MTVFFSPLVILLYAKVVNALVNDTNPSSPQSQKPKPSHPK
jgi:hypothetical protein